MDLVRRTLPAVFAAAIAAALFAFLPAGAAAHGEGSAAVVTHGDNGLQLGGPKAARELRKRAAATGRRKGVRAARATAAQAWCGSPQANDDLASAVNPGLPAIKVVYAFPVDRPDRFRAFAPAIQESILTATRFVASESGGRKTIRFDTGTSCGPDYLDIQWMPLSRPRAAYLDGSGNPLFGQVKAEIETRLSALPGPRNHLVFVDSLLDGASFGQAELRRGADQPGADNVNNDGGQFAFVWGEDGFDPERGKNYELPLLALHEITHTLGAVQLSAPHSTGAGHCGDGADLMCYSESNPNDRKITACADTGAVLVQLDCNKDDYFNPSPPAGSYLASHWNVYDSVFLGSCQELASFCAAAPAPAAEPQPAVVRRSTRRASLKRLRRGRVTGRSLGRMTVRVERDGASTHASLSTSRLRLGAGRWRLRSCLQPGAGQASASRGVARSATSRSTARASAGGRCRTRTVRVRGRGSVKAPTLTIAAPEGTKFLAASVDLRPVGGAARASRADSVGPRRPLVVSLAS